MAVATDICTSLYKYNKKHMVYSIRLSLHTQITWTGYSKRGRLTLDETCFLQCLAVYYDTSTDTYSTGK